MNFGSKKWWEVKFFSQNQSISSVIPMRRMNLWCPIIRRVEITMWISICPNCRANINSKKGKKKVFLAKPQHQYHLSQWEKCVYGAQLWNERRLLHKSLFIPIDKRTLIPKNGRKWSSYYGTKHQFICPNEENKLVVPNP